MALLFLENRALLFRKRALFPQVQKVGVGALAPNAPGSAASVSTCQTPPGKEMSLDVG